jgi:hypothetical protein
MKRTRKQKLQRRKDKQQRSDERKFEIVERMLDLIGVTELFAPFTEILKEGLIRHINPHVVVEPSEDCNDDPLVATLCGELEELIQTPTDIVLCDRVVLLALADFFRGYNPLVFFIRTISRVVNDPRSIVQGELLDRFNATVRKIDQFDREEIGDAFSWAMYPLDQLADDYLRFDEQVAWYRIEAKATDAGRVLSRVVVGRKKQVPVALAVAEGIRKAYPCECHGHPDGLLRLTWNPATLGIGSDSRDLPVFVGTHAIERLHERVPLAPYLSLLHGMMRDAIEEPRLRPRPASNDFLLEVGRQGRKVGYFVAELYDAFVYLRTFLFLTMQGTPEADCLRERLRLSRSEIEYYKLDNYFTFTMSDLGQDPELREALALCKCDHLLDLAKPAKRVAWLERFGAPFRKRVGLPFEGLTTEGPKADASSDHEIEQITEYSRRILKTMQGWVVE